ncbi:hypothetical protein Tco_0360309 [Tanacetum coccineum]
MQSCQKACWEVEIAQGRRFFAKKMVDLWDMEVISAEEFEASDKDSKKTENDEAKDDESTKKSGKRRKQMARRGLHTNVDKDDSEDSDEVGEQEESVTGTKTPINPVPVAMKTPSIATIRSSSKEKRECTK